MKALGAARRDDFVAASDVGLAMVSMSVGPLEL